MRTLISLFFLFLMVGINSCRKDTVNNDAEFLAQLKNSPDSVTIGVNSIRVEAYLWRDFMPVSEPNGDALRSLVKLSVGQNQTLPKNITLFKQYVINGVTYWTADFERIDMNGDQEIEGLSSDGPKWEPQAKVDVVLEFILNGKHYRVMERNREIAQTF